MVVRTLRRHRRALRALGGGVGALLLTNCSRASSPSAAPRAASYRATAADVALADTVAERTFRWFWETTPAETGLVHDRYPKLDFSSVASIGFGLTAYGIGAERGWITRTQAAERTLTTLRYLWQLPQGPAATGVSGFHGFFYHFLNYTDGSRFKTVELSTIDTSLLLMGALFAQSYYDGDGATERTIRAYADSLYRRVEWPWIMPRPPRVSMGWHPEKGFIQADWAGYNEAMLLYVLALGSPTHAIGPEAWTAWTSTYKWRTYRGQPHVNFSPLFGHQYSHAWIDFRGIRDAYMRGRGIDYFENARRATYSQRAYAIANPGGFTGYDSLTWGLTACDGPADTTVTINGRTVRLRTYWARGVSANADMDGDTEERDDGTIAPTAAIGSVAFAPEIVLPTMRTMRERYGRIIFDRYGFRDAFNPSLRDPALRTQQGTVDRELGWVGRDYLGIDQGPILLMLENWRSDFVWSVMRRNVYIVRGLRRAGFAGGWLDTSPLGR
ncbi:MAG: hypothetical protein MUF00_06150 [Gemmatimonadaceae bacterium]|jgi:hypothetical protein|nr:hypothetical protein [Gemmatimonadaceae bacterium]